MAVPAHLEDAVARLSEAAWRIDRAKAKAFTTETQREWLAALTEYSLALSDIHRFNNESIHEKLHDLIGRLERVSRSWSSAQAPAE
jgi:hypothetical protein